MKSLKAYAAIQNRGPPEPDSNSDSDREYCFLHGFDKHHGHECGLMRADSKFTDKMKAAKAPCDIDGIDGSIKNQLLPISRSGHKDAPGLLQRRLVRNKECVK